jgi:hypothetical protein
MITHAIRIIHSLVREHIVKRSTRSDKWPAARKAFLKSNPECAACGSTTLLQVHHCKPFHLDPALELDPNNFITLCMSSKECHILLGHGDNFKMFNPDVREQARYVKEHPESFELIVEKAKELRQSQL